MSSVNLTSLGANQLKNTTSGEMVEIGSLWQEQTVVLFFLRRFGCQVCRWMSAEVSKLEKDLKANGVALIGIGPEEMGVKEFMDGGFFKGGGEKVLLHFVQKSPADNISLEDITKGLGISASVQAGEKPQVKQEAFVRLILRCYIYYTIVQFING
uniref:Peroxiredoxin like 2B n=1 Tax=Sinocyclocheilus grahami TaxID=75366 RepID=A0A672QSJ9_SINGR